MAKKVWSTVQALRAQLFESSFNEANLCPPTPFFACYTLAAMIPISFFGVLCSEEEKRDKIDVDYVAGINSLAVSHRRRMAPEAFVRPALRQTKHWTWVMGFSSSAFIVRKSYTVTHLDSSDAYTFLGVSRGGGSLSSDGSYSG